MLTVFIYHAVLQRENEKDSPPIIRRFNFVNTNNPVRCCKGLFQIFQFDILVSNFNPPGTIIPAIPKKALQNTACTLWHTLKKTQGLYCH